MNATWNAQDLIAAALVAVALSHLTWRAWRTLVARSSLENAGCGGGCQGCPSSGDPGIRLVTLTIPSDRPANLPP